MLAFISPDLSLVSGLWWNKSGTELLEESVTLAPWRVLTAASQRSRVPETSRLLQCVWLLLRDILLRTLRYAMFGLRLSLIWRPEEALEVYLLQLAATTPYTGYDSFKSVCSHRRNHQLFHN